MGHPLGGELSMSLSDSLQGGSRSPRHYGAPTASGRSGTPMFDAAWRVMALHHAGVDRIPALGTPDDYYDANEGIWIHAIRHASAEAT